MIIKGLVPPPIFDLRMRNSIDASVATKTNQVEQVNDTWSPELYNRNASFVYSAAFTSTVMTLLDPKEGEKILDLGCGSGELTVQLQTIVGSKGIVVGVDNSKNMIETAKRNGVKHALVADAQELVFSDDLEQYQGQFDAVFSNAALHWCKQNPGGVLEGVRKSLRKGGRFVCEMGGFMNCCGVRAALREVLDQRGYKSGQLDPWYFPSVEDYQALLKVHRYSVERITLQPRLTLLPGTLVDWLRTFCRESWLKRFEDEEAEEIMREVQRVCIVDHFDGQRWSVMYVRLRFVAVSQ